MNSVNLSPRLLDSIIDEKAILLIKYRTFVRGLLIDLEKKKIGLEEEEEKKKFVVGVLDP